CPPRRRPGRPRAALPRLAAALYATGSFSAAGSVCCAVSLPVTEFLNSRMPLPSERPISGTRFGPKTTRARTRRITRPCTPMNSGMERSFRHAAGLEGDPRCGVEEVEAGVVERQLDLSTRRDRLLRV